MKKRILSLLLAVITIIQIMPWSVLTVIAEGGEDETTGIDIADMEVGKLYRAKFMSDIFVPYARYPFIDSGILDRSQMPGELTVIRESADDYDLVYVTEHTANWPSEYTDYRYVTANKLSIAGGISVDSMEIGQIYTATWNTTDTGVYLYKKVPASESDIFVEYGYNSDQYIDPVVSTDGCPTELIVCLENENDPYVRVTNEDWPNEYAQYRYLDSEYDVVILGEYVPTPDDGLIRGEVGLTMDGKTVTSLSIAEDEKTYVFTELSDKLDGNPSYRWQLLIDRENNRWATVQDYVYPYAPISAALIANAGQENGAATLRCIATQDGKNYVSGELDISVDPSLPEPDLPLIPTVQSGSMTPLGAENGVAPVADGEDAFQITVNYVFARLNEDKVHENAHTPYIVSLGPGETFTGSVDSPFIIGYTACIQVDRDTPNAQEFEGNYYIEQPTWVFTDVGVDDTEKQKVTIYYVPQKTNFIVEHYYQNLKDDGYSLSGMDVNKEKYADEAVGEGLARDVYGYTPLFYDATTTVSGNGNTVIEIYYDRVYYLVDFELDGGYGLMPYYVRYGTSVMLTEPTKPGYSFVNPWQLDRVYTVDEDTKAESEVDKEGNRYIDNMELSAAYKNKNANELITVQHNLNYKANWRVDTASYTIIYWRENADSTDPSNKANYSVWATETKSAVSGSTVDCSDLEISDKLATNQVDGKDQNEKEFFTRANAMSDLSVVVKGDGTSSVNIYYTRNTYHIWFKGISGTCKLDEHTHGDGKCDTVMFCAREEHSHGTGCYATTNQCGVTTEHTHNDTHGNNNSCCKIATHTHSKSCYTATGNNVTISNNAAGNTIANTLNNQVGTNNNDEIIVQYYDAGWMDWNNYSGYYLKVGNSWYKINNYSANNTTISIICGRIQHSANDGKCVYSCGYVEHTHSDACKLTCKKEAHTHNNNDCYSPCTKYTHTHNNNCNATSTENYVYALSAKYGADIADKWPTAEYVNTHINSDYKLYGWTGITNNQLVTKRVNMTSDLCDVNDYVKEGKSSGPTNTSYRFVYYLFESFDQTSAASGNERQLKNNIYFDSDSRYYQRIDGLNQGLSAKTITGMKPVSTDSTNSGNNVFLYYTRNRHTITFENVGVEIYTMSDIMYEQPLNKAFFDSKLASYSGKTEQWDFVDKDGNTVKVTIPIPNTPSTYEEGSVVFAGWYTTPLCADGTEYNFANGVMPDAEIKLFAKWLPTTHNVKVYRQESEIDSTEPGKLLLDRTVEFGTQIQESDLAEYTKPNENYIFGGWYYVDENGEENRYDFNTMVVKHAYVIYAKWIKNVPIPYTVKYVTEIDGQKVEIAPQESGVALEGVMKTFTAKAGADLDEGYREWYFPHDRYITFTMSANTDENVVEFIYETSTTATYTISHVFKHEDFQKYFGTDTFTYNTVFTITMGASGEEGQFQAFIRERFNDLVNEKNIKTEAKNQNELLTNPQQTAVWNIVKGLTPDYYQQELHLVIDSAQNVMTFTWEDAGATTMYQVIHYTQNKDLQTYSIFSTEGYIVPNEPGKEYTANCMEIYGFNPKATTVSGELPSGTALDGLVLELYYDRAYYTYTVHHYVVGTTQKLADDVVYNGSSDALKQAFYEQEISVSDVAQEINGYLLYNGDTTRTIGADNLEITCLYSPLKVTFRYQEAIAGRGNLSKVDDYYGEVGILPDSTKSSCTATAKPGYVFVGWFLDADATKPVSETTVAQLTDNGTTVTPLAPTADMANKIVVFYAKFVPTTLTVSNTVTAGTNTPDWVIPGQGFIYKIEGKTDTATEGISLTVAVPVDEELTILGLPLGDYSITLEGDWSWRYKELTCNIGTISEDKQNMSFTFNGGENVSFTYNAPGNDTNNGYYITDGAYNDPTPKSEP